MGRAMDAVDDGALDAGSKRNGTTVTGASTTIQWDATSRVASVRYEAGAHLTAAAAVVLIDALSGWVGSTGEPFAVLADGTGLGGTDAEYRAAASAFFRRHRRNAHIALVNLGPVLHVVVEMFRVGTGIPLKSFGNEAAARAWLRAKGIPA
jgi:hypothetical protein